MVKPISTCIVSLDQDEILKNMITQKERVASSQKEALKKERELSVKLRQAIQKINFKQQQVQKLQ